MWRCGNPLHGALDPGECFSDLCTARRTGLPLPLWSCPSSGPSGTLCEAGPPCLPRAGLPGACQLSAEPPTKKSPQGASWGGTRENPTCAWPWTLHTLRAGWEHFHTVQALWSSLPCDGQPCNVPGALHYSIPMTSGQRQAQQQLPALLSVGLDVACSTVSLAERMQRLGSIFQATDLPA